MVYEWKPGSRVNLDPQVVGETLERIRIRDGGLTPAAVVEEARPESSPLHRGFEWDDSVAAELYRQEQARYMIRHLVVKRVVPEKETPVRAFVLVTPKPKQEYEEEERPKPVYTNITEALADPELRQQVLRRALEELQQWRQRYRNLKELAEIFAAADKLLSNF